MAEKRDPQNKRGLTIIEGGGVTPPPPPSPPGPPAEPPRPPSPFETIMRQTRPARQFVAQASYFWDRNHLDFWKLDANHIARIHKFFPSNFDAMRRTLEKAVHCPTDANAARIFLASVVKQWQPGRMDPDAWPDWVLEEIADDDEDGFDGFSLMVIVAAFRALRPGAELKYLPTAREFVDEAKRQRELFADILGKLGLFKKLREAATRDDMPSMRLMISNDGAYDAWEEKWGLEPVPPNDDPDAPF